MPIRFQQRCVKCRKNMVPMTSSRQFPICSQCQMKEISEPIKNAKMRKFFDVPVELYEQSSFLRSIKSQYMRFGGMTPAQKEAFIKVVKEMQDPSLKGEREAKKRVFENKLTPKEKLLAALDKIVAKDSKDKRRKALEVIADIELSGINAPEIQDAVSKLLQKSRGRPKLLMMTPEEIKAVRDSLGAA